MKSRLIGLIALVFLGFIFGIYPALVGAATGRSVPDSNVVPDTSFIPNCAIEHQVCAEDGCTCVVPAGTLDDLNCLTCPDGKPEKVIGNGDCNDTIDLADFLLWKDVYQGILTGRGSSFPQIPQVDFACVALEPKVDLVDYVAFYYGYRGIPITKAPTATLTPSPSPMPTATPVPTNPPRPTPTFTPTPTPTATPVPGNGDDCLSLGGQCLSSSLCIEQGGEPLDVSGCPTGLACCSFAVPLP